MLDEHADPPDFVVDDRPIPGDDDTGVVIPADAGFEQGDVLSYARRGAFAPPPESESFGDLMGRYSLICALLLFPAILFSVLFYIPLLAGISTSLAALISKRGRSVSGWVGFAIHGSLVSLLVWIVLSAR